MHVTAAQPTNLESVPVSSATNQQSSTAEATESGSHPNTSCKNKKISAASGKRQQQRQHGNLDDEVKAMVKFHYFIFIYPSLKFESLR